MEHQEYNQKIADIYGRIQQQRKIMEGLQAMRSATPNPEVKRSAEAQIREAQRNISYFEESLHSLRMRSSAAGTPGSSTTDGSTVSTSGGSSSGASTAGAQGSVASSFASSGPTHRSSADSHGAYQPGNPRGGGPAGALVPSSPSSQRRPLDPALLSSRPLPPPPGADPYGAGQGSMAGMGTDGQEVNGGGGRAGWVPADGRVDGRKQYTNLDLIKHDTPHTTAKISRMLHQLEFKLQVERQYKQGIDKMSKLYQAEGDKKSRNDAEQKRVESNQKIILLQQALKRYKTLHILDEAEGDEDLATGEERRANLRKPLSGTLHVSVLGARDLDHAPAPKRGRGVTESFVGIKIEDKIVAKTHPSRTDRWGEDFEISVENANEVEVTVYDRHSGEHPVPVGMLWIRISDILEELRRTKFGNEVIGPGWVTADRMRQQGGGEAGTMGSGDGSMAGDGSGPHNVEPAPNPLAGMPAPGVGTQEGIQAWFSVEPAGAIGLQLNFVKQNVRKRPYDARLGRQGAVRKRKEEVNEVNGHQFVARQFYQIMMCALCGEFLLKAQGAQCEDCKYTCHQKCSQKVVIKCISKSNSETDRDEIKINHRIPHRFEPLTSISPNWCCHCGSILPIGRPKHSRKCSECGLTCHTDCAHLVPDFCGMSMEVANQLISVQEAISKQRKGKPAAGGYLGPGEREGGPQKSPASATAPVGPPAGAMHDLETRTQHMQLGQQQQQQQEPPAQAYGRMPPQQQQQQQQGPPQRPYDPRYPQDGGYGQRPSPGQTPPSSAGGPVPSPYDQGKQGLPSGRPMPPTVAVQMPPPVHPSQAHVGALQQAAQQQQQQQQRPTPPRSPASSVPPSMPVTAPSPPGPQSAGVVAAAGTPSSSQMQVQSSKRKVGLNDFNFLAVLGKGNFGKVMLAEEKSSSQLYAIKVLKKEFIIENDEVESTKSEKRVFLTAARERHPFLLGLHSCFQTETRVYFVMEYVSGGDLMLHIQREQFTPRRAKFYAAEVLLALEYFHKNGIIYRDLKLDNILLTLDGHIKLADYGLCKEDMWYGRATSTFCGTPEFMAPEILLEQRYGRAVDWWAFGVLIYEMLLGQSPFRGDDEEDIFDAILEDEPLYPIHMPHDSVSILEKLLTRDVSKRLGAGREDAEEIKRHPFFRDVDWDAMLAKRVPPPFFPSIDNPSDLRNFDTEFTREQPTLTPVHSTLSPQDQAEFASFSWTASWAGM